MYNTTHKHKIKGRINAITNFLNHLKTKGHSIEEYKEYKNKQSKNLRKRSCSINNNVQSEGPSITTQKKQRLLKSTFSRNNQQIVNDLIISFVVETMSPIDIVEHLAFKNLVYGNIVLNDYS